MGDENTTENFPEVKYCKDCKWSKPEKHSSWNLKCTHPKVNGKNAYSLANNSDSEYSSPGVSCLDERKNTGFLGFFVICGKSGKLFRKK